MTVKPEKDDEEKEDLKSLIEGCEKTHRLFYEDTYLKEFDATIIDIIQGKYVVLNQTAFYAEGGGQLSDIGIIQRDSDTFKLTAVQSIEGVLLHELEDHTLRKGDKIHGIVDWDRRISL